MMDFPLANFQNIQSVVPFLTHGRSFRLHPDLPPTLFGASIVSYIFMHIQKFQFDQVCSSIAKKSWQWLKNKCLKVKRKHSHPLANVPGVFPSLIILVWMTSIQNLFPRTVLSKTFEGIDGSQNPARSLGLNNLLLELIVLVFDSVAQKGLIS